MGTDIPMLSPEIDSCSDDTDKIDTTSSAIVLQPGSISVPKDDSASEISLLAFEADNIGKMVSTETLFGRVAQDENDKLNVPSFKDKQANCSNSEEHFFPAESDITKIDETCYEESEKLGTKDYTCRKNENIHSRITTNEHTESTSRSNFNNNVRKGRSAPTVSTSSNNSNSQYSRRVSLTNQFQHTNSMNKDASGYSTGVDSVGGYTPPRSISPPYTTQSISSSAQQQQQFVSHRIVSMAPVMDQNQGQGYMMAIPAHHGMNHGDYINTSMPMAEMRTNSSRQLGSVSNGGRRSIHLRLVEETDTSPSKKNGLVKKNRFFNGQIRLPRVRGTSTEPGEEYRDQNGNSTTPKHDYSEARTLTDLGTVVVSWYEGTTSAELQDHVRNSVCRKLGKQVDDIRLLDEGCIPHEEVVLTPYIPDGTRFMVKFSAPIPVKTILRFASRAPDSPSRAPTPYASEVDLPTLKTKNIEADESIPPLPILSPRMKSKSKRRRRKHDKGDERDYDSGSSSSLSEENNDPHRRKTAEGHLNKKDDGKSTSLEQKQRGASLNSQDQKQRSSSFNSQQRGATLNSQDRKQRSSSFNSLNSSSQLPRIIYRNASKTEEKRRVIFVLANYFVLFLSMIAIFAELHDRGPRWIEQLDQHANRVHECAVDSDSLFKCIEAGDISGLLASFALWIAKNNKMTTRFFLFGFDSAQKLWTVVYEAMVTAICWGTSYLFIRRAMNPDTRVNFLEKYWKDAIYGSLAGFNAAFMKAVLKNLIPQEVLEDVLDNRPGLRILDIFRGAIN